jgi:hypothetical protein
MEIFVWTRYMTGSNRAQEIQRQVPNFHERC